MFNSEERRRQKELDSLYRLVDGEVEDFANLLETIEEHNASTMAEFVEKEPFEAYANGIIRDSRLKPNREESIKYANEYLENEIKAIEEIINDIEENDGEVRKARLQLAGVVQYCKENIQE